MLEREKKENLIKFGYRTSQHKNLKSSIQSFFLITHLRTQGVPLCA